MQQLAMYQKKNELVRRLSPHAPSHTGGRGWMFAVGFLVLLLPCRGKPGLCRDKPGLRWAGGTLTPAKPLLRQLL